VVAATPDAPSEALAFPASHARVIAARSSAGTPAQGIPFVVDAPGTEIITTTPDAGYAFLSGNSLAAAHVTGVVALLLERNPRIDVDLIVQLLTDTTTAGRRGFSINACEALAALTGGAQCRERSALSF
jgi:subtilisin family serine protease